MNVMDLQKITLQSKISTLSGHGIESSYIILLYSNSIITIFEDWRSWMVKK
jgi:hypothetical protein